MKILKILTRVYSVNPESDIPFYETLFNIKCGRIIDYKEMGLQLALMGNVLIICGTGKALEPFRETAATFLVDSVDDYKKYLLENNAEIVWDVKKVPTGLNMTVKHSDGIIIEYVEFMTMHS